MIFVVLYMICLVVLTAKFANLVHSLLKHSGFQSGVWCGEAESFKLTQ